jgi:hypothetical protein
MCVCAHAWAHEGQSTSRASSMEWPEPGTHSPCPSTLPASGAWAHGQEGVPMAMAVTCTAQHIEAMHATTVTNHGKAWQWWPCRRQQCDVALTTSRMDAASMNWGRLVFRCRARGRLSSRTATWDPRPACTNAVPRAPEPATRARQTGLASLTCPPSASVRARETWGFAGAYAHQLLWVQIVIDTSACASCSCQSRT